MAEPDHTVPARLSGQPKARLTHLPGYLPASFAKDEKTQRDMHSVIVEVEEARLVVELLLGNSEDLGGVLSSNALERLSSWPLPAAVHASRLVSNHFLNRCTDAGRCRLNG